MPRLDITSAQLQTVALATIGKSSLAGVQRKISVGLYKDRSTLRIEAGGGGRFILKPQSPSLDQLPENEHVTMELARRFGLAVPDSSLVELADGSLAYLVARFDRPAGGGKRRQEDFCQLRLLPPAAKYKATGIECADTVRRFSSEPAADLIRLFETFVFAFWTGNGDHHLKNISLLADVEGRHLLSPVYDQVCTALYPAFDPELALALVDDARKRPTAEDWLLFASACGLTARGTQRLLARPAGLLAEAVALVGSSYLDAPSVELYTAILAARTAELESAGLLARDSSDAPGSGAGSVAAQPWRHAGRQPPSMPTEK